MNDWEPHRPGLWRGWYRSLAGCSYTSFIIHRTETSVKDRIHRFRYINNSREWINERLDGYQWESLYRFMKWYQPGVFVRIDDDSSTRETVEYLCIYLIILRALPKSDISSRSPPPPHVDRWQGRTIDRMLYRSTYSYSSTAAWLGCGGNKIGWASSWSISILQSYVPLTLTIDHSNSLARLNIQSNQNHSVLDQYL